MQGLFYCLLAFAKKMLSVANRSAVRHMMPNFNGLS